MNKIGSQILTPPSTIIRKIVVVAEYLQRVDDAAKSSAKHHLVWIVDLSEYVSNQYEWECSDRYAPKLLPVHSQRNCILKWDGSAPKGAQQELGSRHGRSGIGKFCRAVRELIRKWVYLGPHSFFGPP